MPQRNDLSRSPIALDQIAHVVEMSQSDQRFEMRSFRLCLPQRKRRREGEPISRRRLGVLRDDGSNPVPSSGLGKWLGAAGHFATNRQARFMAGHLVQKGATAATAI